MTFYSHVRTAAAIGLAVAALTAGANASAQAPIKALTAAELRSQGKTRVIIAFKPGAAVAARAAAAAAGGRVVVDLDDVDAFAVELPRKALAALQRSRHVDYIEEDVPRYAFGMASATAAAAASVAVTPQTVPYGIGMVQADQVPDSLASGRVLCIIDSGYDLAHEDLGANTVSGVNLTTSGLWSTDESHHGTHVAGTIAAINNSLGVIGVLPNKQLKLYIAKVFDGGGSASASTITKGINACRTAKANVVSMSLGGPASKTEERAINKLVASNALVIAAAGNAGTSAVSYPAGLANVVSVAAVDSNKAFASFSQFNSDVELSGPGVGVLSTVPMGTGVDVSLSVGGTSFAALGIDGSPVKAVTAPLADFGLGDAVNTAVSGKVCLIARGTIAFSDKVLNCQNSGGVGAVIYNNAPGSFGGTLGGLATTIPSGTVSDTDGAAMKTKLGQSTTLSLAASNYAYFDGTSMATPHVSAVAALVWSYFPSCTATQIRDTLAKSAQDLGDPGRDVHYGFGLVQAKSAYDRINTLGCGK